jgi:hypothetical protein
MLQSMLDHLE